MQDQEAMRLAEQVCELYRMYASSLAYMYACVVYYHCGTSVVPVWRCERVHTQRCSVSAVCEPSETEIRGVMCG